MSEELSIQRHKTAIRRTGLSVPVKCLLRDSLLSPEVSFFDYGCGRGQDLELLAAMGIPATGWDPAYQPDSPRLPAEVVNLGYVVNVIEDADERVRALRTAWELCQSVLVVSAISHPGARDDRDHAAYADGVLTSRGTFQKYYSHQELRAFLEQHLPTDAVPAAPNIFYLFKSEELRQQLLSSRFRERLMVPNQRVAEIAFENNRELLEPFMETLTALGRIPAPDEFPQHDALVQRFGSAKRAFRLVSRVTGTEAWGEIAEQRRQDLLVYLALARFGRRSPLAKLPQSTQHDIRAFCGTYKNACEEADQLLFSLGRPGVVDDACRRAPIGALVDNALVIRTQDLNRLEPVLRIFEGCARVLAGDIEGANVLKLHRLSGKVTYLVCRDLETDANPALEMRVKVTLPNLAIDVFDYSARGDCSHRLDVPTSFLGGCREQPPQEI